MVVRKFWASVKYTVAGRHETHYWVLLHGGAVLVQLYFRLLWTKWGMAVREVENPLMKCKKGS